MSVKAFNLVQAIERIILSADNKPVGIKIETMECSGNSLYVGTSESFIIEFSLEEKSHPNGKIYYTNRKEKLKYLDSKKPVRCIKAASALNRILAYCDSNLFILNMTDLEILGDAPKLKGLSAFCVNENPDVSDPFSIQICVAKRKQLQIYNVTDEKLIHIKDINATELPVAVAMDGNYICAALTKKYMVFHCETGLKQELFTYSEEGFIPLVHRISKEEFLLSAPGGLGMFVTAAGISERPPIQWMHSLRGVAFCQPYIIGLSAEVIMIYSILDQQQKQSLPFSNGRCLGNFDGKLYVSTTTSVYGLLPIPWERQVQDLITSGLVEEALQLAENANHAGMPKEQFRKLFTDIQKRGAFIHLAQGSYQEAKSLLRTSRVDVREVISLFPHMLPPSSTFIRSVPLLHDIADIVQMNQGDEGRIMEAKQFLMDYLEELRAAGEIQHHYLEVDTALIKLYAAFSSPELEPFIRTSNTNCDQKDCVMWLTKYKRFHSLAVFHHQCGNNEQALDVWKSIINDEYQDSEFPGLEFFVEVLANIKDHNLVWRYVDYVMEKDQLIGVQIFTKRPEGEIGSENMNTSLIVEYLQRFPNALLLFLQHAVLEKEIQNEALHTHLVMIYLEDVVRLRKQDQTEDLQEARERLQHLFLASSLYRVNLMLGKLVNTDLYEEMAILYGKLEDHEQALNILVHKLKNYQSAEQYCVKIFQDGDNRRRRKVFHILLNVYLSPADSEERQSELLTVALELLNTHASEFNATQVIQSLPTTWSISMVDNFMKGALRTQMHQNRMKKIERFLARGENVHNKFSWFEMCRDPVVLLDTNYCCVCKKPFRDANFARFPNGVITHIECVRQKNICPLTGSVFKDV